MDSFQRFAYLGQLSNLKTLLTNQPDLVDKHYSSPQKTPLFYAILQNETEVVSYLLSVGVQTSFPILSSSRKQTALHFASALNSSDQSSLSIFQSLISASQSSSGFDINSLSPEGCTVLHNLTNHSGVSGKDSDEKQAQTIHHLKVELSLKAGADPNIPSEPQSGITPLHNSIISNNIPLVDILLKFGGDLTKKTSLGFSVLHLSASLPSSEMSAFLLAQKTVIDEKMWNWRDGDGQTPLHTAVSHGSLSNVRLLLDSSHFGGEEERKKYIDSPDNDGVTPLIMACLLPLTEGPEIVEELIQAGASVNLFDHKGFGPIHAAASSANYLSLQILCKAGVDINAQTVEGDTAGHLAASLLVPLLDKTTKKENEDQTEEDDQTNLLEILKAYHQRIFGTEYQYSATRHLEVLFDFGMNPDIENKQSVTPLHYAVASGLAEAVQYLIGIGSVVDVNVIDLEKYLDIAVPTRMEHYKTDPANFAQISYWDRYYKHDSSPFEWYESYRPLRKLIQKYCSSDKDQFFLLTGCGTSELGFSLYTQDQYHRIWNMDLSEYVIQHMTQLHPPEKYPGLVYDLMDVQKMTYADHFFDCIIDKGMLDCFYCSDDVDRNVDLCLSQVSRVLKPNGIFFLITWGGPDVRLPHLEQTKYNWKVLSLNLNPNSEQNLSKPEKVEPSEKSRNYARLFFHYVLKKNQ